MSDLLPIENYARPDRCAFLCGNILVIALPLTKTCAIRYYVTKLGKHMRLKYLNFYNDKEIRNAVYNYLFSFCNKVKLRSSVGNYTINEACGTVDNKIYLYEIERKNDSVWGMQGCYITFKLSAFIKNILKKYSLEGLFLVEKDNDKILFDNITLLHNDDILFSCCTHEGYIDFDNDIECKLDLFCLKKLKNTNTYKNMRKNYLSLRKIYSDEEVLIIHDKLQYLHCYVDKACGAYIRQSSEYDDITWTEYLELAQKVFSKEICIELEKASSFEQLQTFQTNKSKTKYYDSQFILSPLYYSIGRELAFLSLFIDV